MTGRRVWKGEDTSWGTWRGTGVCVSETGGARGKAGDVDEGTKIALRGHVAHFHFLCPNIQFTDSCIQILVAFPLMSFTILPSSRVHARTSSSSIKDIFSQCLFTLSHWFFAGHVAADLHISSRLSRRKKPSVRYKNEMQNMSLLTRGLKTLEGSPGRRSAVAPRDSRRLISFKSWSR